MMDEEKVIAAVLMVIFMLLVAITYGTVEQHRQEEKLKLACIAHPLWPRTSISVISPSQFFA